MKRINCRLCQNHNIQLVLSLGNSPPANEFLKEQKSQEHYPLDLYRCSTCGHYQLLDIVDPEILFKNYVYVSGTSALMRDHFQDYAKSISELIYGSANTLSTAPKLIVDIGSNDGTLLGYLQKFGFDVVGIDPAEKIAKEATDKGINTINAFFNIGVAKQIRKQYGRADVITANNVFAHTDDLDEIVLGVQELMTNKGYFIFEASYFEDVMKAGDFSQIYHEHLSYHTVMPLVQYFKRFDMEIVDVQHNSNHGGSIRCFVRNKSTEPNTWVASHYSEYESDMKLFQSFKSRIEKLKSELKPMLLDLKKQGKKIAGVTASAKSTTFLHYCDIGSDILDFIADDAKEKVGTFSPGKQMPIKPFSTIYSEKPDYLLMLSFNFVEFIRKKHHDYKGKWVIPMPTLQVL